MKESTICSARQKRCLLQLSISKGVKFSKNSNAQQPCSSSPRAVLAYSLGTRKGCIFTLRTRNEFYLGKKNSILNVKVLSLGATEPPCIIAGLHCHAIQK